MKKIVFFIWLVFLFSGCGSYEGEEAAIKIGEIKVTASEFNHAFQASQFAHLGEAAKEEFLDTFISRKLILKEAERRGLDKDAQFLQDIQLFWEQSLLKRALSLKIKELALEAKVTDKEIRSYYQSHKDIEFTDKKLEEVYGQIRWIVFKGRQKEVIGEWADSLKKDAKIEIDYKRLGIE